MKRLVAMEFSIPEAAWLRFLYHVYSFRVMPVAGKWITGTADPFHYLAESIRVFPPPEQVREMLAVNGFVNAGF